MGWGERERGREGGEGERGEGKERERLFLPSPKSHHAPHKLTPPTRSPSPKASFLARPHPCTPHVSACALPGPGRLPWTDGEGRLQQEGRAQREERERAAEEGQPRWRKGHLSWPGGAQFFHLGPTLPQLCSRALSEPPAGPHLIPPAPSPWQLEPLGPDDKARPPIPTGARYR